MDPKLGKLEFAAPQTLVPWPGNPRKNEASLPRVRASVQAYGFGAPIVARLANREIIAGHTRWQAALDLKLELVPVRLLDVTEAQAHALALADNRTHEYAEWDDARLREALDALQAAGEDPGDMGFVEEDLQRLAQLDQPPGSGDGKAGDGAAAKSLAERWGAPPFTVLDARQGYWKERKAQWQALGVRGEEGREDLGDTSCDTTAEYMKGRGSSTGGSVFDPVLAELVLRWFAPPGGTVLDPFGGEATKGIVAAALGYRYVAVELREEQVRANYDQAERVREALGRDWAHAPEWHCGDSARISDVVPRLAYDLCFTSPPYYDLEVYSDQAADGSAKQTYGEFMEFYAGVFRQCVALLAPGRHLVVKVGDVRDDAGGYRGFVHDNARLFTELGLLYYNEAVLLTPLGSAPVRAAMQFRKGRKLCRAHQNVLGFVKPPLDAMRRALPEEVSGVELPETA